MAKRLKWQVRCLSFDIPNCSWLCSLFKFDQNENQRDDADRMTLSGTLENSLQ